MISEQLDQDGKGIHAGGEHPVIPHGLIGSILIGGGERAVEVADVDMTKDGIRDTGDSHDDSSDDRDCEQHEYHHPFCVRFV